MGKYAQKYAQLLNESRETSKEPDAVQDPAGYLEHNKQERKKNRLRKRIRQDLMGFSNDYDRVTACLEKALGKKRANEIMDDALENNVFDSELAKYVRANPAVLGKNKPDQKVMESNKRLAMHVKTLQLDGKFTDPKFYEIWTEIALRTINRLKPEEEIAFVSALEDTLEPEKVDRLYNGLNDYKDPIDIGKGQDSIRIYEDKVKDLKKKIPSRIKKDPVKLEQYKNALDFAAENILVVKEEVREELDKHEIEIQKLTSRVQNSIVEKNKDSFKNGVYENLTEDVPGYRLDFVVVPKEKEVLLDQFINDKMLLSDRTKEGIRLIIDKMKEMKLLDYGYKANGEDDNKEFAFRKILAHKEDLKKAIDDKDPDRIIEASATYKKDLEDMKEIYRIAREHFNDDDKMFPGNLDSIRNEDIPSEFSSDLRTTAQVNAVFLTLVNLTVGKSSLDEYLENPTGALMQAALNQLKPNTFEEKASEVKTFDDAVDLLTSTGKFEQADNIFRGNIPIYGFQRALDGPNLLESDKNTFNGNCVLLNRQGEYIQRINLNGTAKHGYLTMISEHAEIVRRKEKTVLNILVASDEDRNLNAMLSGLPVTDMMGRIIGQPFDPDKYLEEKGADYENIVKRGSRLIEKTATMGKGDFNVGDAVECVQNSYIHVLKKMEHEKDTPGYKMMVAELGKLALKLPGNIKPEQRDRVINRTKTFMDETYAVKDIEGEKAEREVPYISGQFTQNYGRMLLAARKKGNEPDAAKDPEGYLEYRKQVRRNERTLKYIRDVLRSRNYSYEEFTSSLEKALGANGAKEFTEKTLTYPNFQVNLCNHIRKNPDVFTDENRPDAGTLNDDAKLTKYATDLYREGKFPKETFEKIFLDIATGRINRLKPEEEAALAGALEEKMDPEEAAALNKRLSEYVDPLDLGKGRESVRTYDGKIKQLQDNTPAAITQDPEKYAKYRQALLFASQNLLQVNKGLSNELEEQEQDIQKTTAGVNKSIVEKNEKGFKNGAYDNLFNRLPYEKVEFSTVPKEKENAAENLIHEKVLVSDKTKEGYRLIIKKMEEMKLLDYGYKKSGEDDNKEYSFRKILLHKKELEKAIDSQDPDKIIEAADIYEKDLKDMREIYRIAREYFTDNELMFPGNLDSIRNLNVPFEFSSDLKTTAQVNSIFLTMATLKEGKKDLEEYLDNPAGALLEGAVNQIRPYSFEEKAKEAKTFDDALDLLTSTGKYKGMKNTYVSNLPLFGFQRALDGVTLLEGDKSVYNSNAVLIDKQGKFIEQVNKNGQVKYGLLTHQTHDPGFQDRKDITIANLLVASDEDRNLNKMLGGFPETDMYGRVIGESFDAKQYIKDNGADYDKIIERGNKVISKADSGKVKGEFLARDTIEAVQKTYIMVLKTMAGEIGKSGYDKMVRELNNLYEMLPDKTPQAQKDRIKERNDRFLADIPQKEEMVEKLKHLEAERQEAYDKGLQSLKEKVYNGNFVDKMSIDWGAPDIDEKELRAAAALIENESYDIKELGYNKMLKEIRETEENISELMNDPDFRGFVQLQLTKNNRAFFDKTPENARDFTEKWRSYKDYALESRADFRTSKKPYFDAEGNYQNENTNSRFYMDEGDDLILEVNNRPVNTKQDEIEDVSFDHSFDSDSIDLCQDSIIMHPLKMDDDNILKVTGDEPAEFDKRAYKREKERIENLAKSVLDAGIRNHRFLEPTDYDVAADIIISEMLSDSAMQRKFLDKNAGFFKNNRFDTKAMNGAINEVRQQLIKDPLFLKTLNKCPSPGELYGTYKKVVRAQVNRSINQKYERDVKSVKDKKTEDLRKAEEQNKVIRLDDDTVKIISSTWKTLDRINKNHKKSDEMKDLMNALEAVKDKKIIAYKDLERLNDFAVIYHDKRQGIFFSPFTDYGKLRLDTVEKLIQKTDEVLKPVRKEIETAVREAKQQAQPAPRPAP